jgi:hypothetical protein
VEASPVVGVVWLGMAVPVAILASRDEFRGFSSVEAGIVTTYLLLYRHVRPLLEQGEHAGRWPSQRVFFDRQ